MWDFPSIATISGDNCRHACASRLRLRCGMSGCHVVGQVVSSSNQNNRQDISDDLDNIQYIQYIMQLQRSVVTAEPYQWPHDASFDRSTTALVVIDMQRDCTPSTITM